MAASDRKPARRAFFTQALQEGVRVGEVLQGRPQLCLDDLWLLPKARLAEVKPILRPGVSLDLAGDQVVARLPGGARPVVLFSTSDEALALLNEWNGKTPLRASVAAVAARRRCSADTAFEYVLKRFRYLVTTGVCVPANPVY